MNIERGFILIITMLADLEDSYLNSPQSHSLETNSDLKSSLFNFSTPSQMKINNTSIIIRPNYGKIDLKLFVGQIPKEWDEKTMTDFFSGYGEILESQVMRDSKGQSKGCAFAKFASVTKAEEAKKDIETRNISLPGVNKPMQIKWADGEDQRLGIDEHTIPKLFVGSLPKNATEETLTDVFSQFGHIEEQILMKDQDGTSKGSAFIILKNKEDALLAVRFLNGNVYVNGSDKPLEVRFAENKKKASIQTDQSPRGSNPSPINPINNLAFFKDIAPEGIPFYWNPYTMQTQWEEPPAGSYVIPKTSEAPYYVKTTLPSKIPKKQGPQGSNLFIFHLPNDWNEQELNDYFKDFGTIISCRIMKDKKTHKSRGFGFVSYDNAESAQMAVQRMNGFQAGHGKRLKVEIKERKDQEGEDQTHGMSSETKYSPY